MAKAEALNLWTLYDHPKDFPNEFVARRFEVDAHGSRATNDVLTSTSLDLLRGEMLARHLTCLTRSPGDDPKIIETWL